MEPTSETNPGNDAKPADFAPPIAWQDESMPTKPMDFGATLAEWARRTPSVKGLMLIGSRERVAADAVWSADAQSDWDFYVITSKPALFASRRWAEQLPGLTLQLYANHRTVDSRAPKVYALFDGVEADLVILSTPLMRLAGIMVALGMHRREGWARRGLGAIAEVIRPGWRFLKGGERWDPLFCRIVAEVPDPRMSDAAAAGIADVFVANYIWTRRKLERGEFLAAQRMLHRELAEANFRLLHELKLRRGERTFEKARRIERVASADEVAKVTVSARCERAELEAALEKSARSLREIMQALVGESWHWPQVS